MTATSIARALLARGLSDAQVRAAIGSADRVVAGLTAILATSAPTPAPSLAPTPAPTPTAPVAIPADFALSTLPFAVTRTGSGEQSTFATDCDHAAKRPVTATTIHVAPGEAANAAGTQADPVPSINMAIAIGNAMGQPYAIEVAAGTYLTTRTFTRSAASTATYVAAWYNTAPTQNCAIYCPSGTTISSLHAASVTWAATADPNVWRGTTPNDGTKWVVDLSLLDDTGVLTGLDQVRTVADVANPIAEINAAWTATRGASYYRSGIFWVRLPDNRQLTNATVIVGRDFLAATAGGLPTAPTANLRIWIDGLQFRFGKKPFGITTNATCRVNVYARACAFLYASAHGNGGEGAGTFAFAAVRVTSSSTAVSPVTAILTGSIIMDRPGPPRAGRVRRSMSWGARAVQPVGRVAWRTTARRCTNHVSASGWVAIIATTPTAPSTTSTGRSRGIPAASSRRNGFRTAANSRRVSPLVIRPMAWRHKCGWMPAR